MYPPVAVAPFFFLPRIAYRAVLFCFPPHLQCCARHVESQQRRARILTAKGLCNHHNISGPKTFHSNTTWVGAHGSPARRVDSSPPKVHGSYLEFRLANDYLPCTSRRRAPREQSPDGLPSAVNANRLRLWRCKEFVRRDMY